jgi:hypothetical protein
MKMSMVTPAKKEQREYVVADIEWLEIDFSNDALFLVQKVIKDRDDNGSGG